MKIKFKHLILYSGLLLACVSGFFSVFGLSQLFAGASFAVIIMASSLEFAKIVSVSFLQRYWTRISKTLRIYLCIGVIVLVCITSAGIYGFLSNAYQKTATQYEIGENQQFSLSDKKTLFQKTIDNNKSILDTKTKRLDQLSSLRDNQENRLNQAQSNGERNRVRNDINTASSEIQKLDIEIDTLNNKIKPLLDSIDVYENKLIELKSKNLNASEVGPLKYLAKLVNQPMDKVVNWFILLLIFVFDPLAMALVIAANKINSLDFEVEETKSNKETKREKIIVDPTTGEIDLGYNPVSIEKDLFITNRNEEETVDISTIDKEFNITEAPIEEPISKLVSNTEPEEILEEKSKSEPVVSTGQIKLEDIKEIKAQNRGFSKDIPTPSTNTIERIGSNKFYKNSNNDKVYYKKRK